MPELAKVLTQEDLSRSAPTRLDLQDYVSIIDTVRDQDGVGGLILLNEGENQRTEKRRLTVAAKQEGYELTWRTAPEGQLRFVLSRPGEPKAGGRERRAAQPAPAPAPEPAPPARGRRRAG